MTYTVSQLATMTFYRRLTNNFSKGHFGCKSHHLLGRRHPIFTVLEIQGSTDPLHFVSQCLKSATVSTNGIEISIWDAICVMIWDDSPPIASDHTGGNWNLKGKCINVVSPIFWLMTNSKETSWRIMAPGVSRCTKFDPLWPHRRKIWANFIVFPLKKYRRFGVVLEVHRMPLALGSKLSRFTRKNRALDSHFMRFFWTMRAKEHELLLILGMTWHDSCPVHTTRLETKS